jgi:hypothetical protein
VRYQWGALGVANAVHALPAVSHTTRLAHLRGQIGVPRHAGENHTSGDTLTLRLGNYMSDILGNYVSGNSNWNSISVGDIP